MFLIFGPLIGAALLALGDWRWLFVLNLPVLAFALVQAIRWLQPSRDPEPGLDIGAMALLLVGLFGTVLSLSQISNWHLGVSRTVPPSRPRQHCDNRRLGAGVDRYVHSTSVRPYGCPCRPTGSPNAGAPGSGIGLRRTRLDRSGRAKAEPCLADPRAARLRGCSAQPSSRQPAWVLSSPYPASTAPSRRAW